MAIATLVQSGGLEVRINQSNAYTLVEKAKKKEKGFAYASMLVLMNIGKKRSMKDIMLEAFDANRKYAFAKLRQFPILKLKQNIIESFFKSYKQENWIAYICTMLPLIDMWLGQSWV